MIENEMEKFREHEKEFKMKTYSKRALANNKEQASNFVSDGDSRSYSGSDQDGYDSNSD